MGSLGFVNGLFLLGAAGALVPLIIHLIERDRVQRVVFGSVWFLRNASRFIIRRRRMAEIILLLLRMSVVAVLAVAFARPFLWPEGAAAPGAADTGSAGRALLVLVDSSASMSVGSRLADAKARATAALDRGGYGRVAVASFGTQLRSLSSFDDGLEAARRAVEGIGRGSDGTDLAGVLKGGQDLVSGLTEMERSILVVSDLHRSAWVPGWRGDWKMPEGVALTIEDVAPEQLANTAILQMAWPLRMVAGPTPQVLTGKIANYGPEAREIKVSLVVDDKVEEEQKLTIQPDSFAPIRFRRVFDKAGIISGRVTLSPGDAMPADDVYYFAAQVVPKVKVLLVNGQAGVTDLEKNDGFFLRSALAPTADSPCDVREAAPDKLRPEDLDDAGVAIIANAGSIPEESASALRSFVQRGGGVIFFPGGNVSPEAFNASFADVAPCKLRGVVDVRLADAASDGLSIGEIDFTHEVFRIFAAPHQGDFSGARFVKYFQVKDSQAGSVLARFEDGSPAVIEKAVGAGYSVLVASSAAPNSPRWNDLGVQAVFLPLLHQMIGRMTAGGAGTGSAVCAGTRASVQVTDQVDEVRLAPPSGAAATLKVSSLAASGGAGCRTAEFIPASAGVYRVSWGKGEVAVAVNLDPGEADPRKQSTDEISAALGAEPGKGGPRSADEAVKAAALQAEALDARQRLWWYILAGALAALSVEMVLAFKTARR